MATHFLQSNENKTPENYMNAQKDEKKKTEKAWEDNNQNPYQKR